MDVFTKFTEIYVPELELSINNTKLMNPVNNKVNVFKTKKTRYVNSGNMSGFPPVKIKTVVISGEKVHALRWLANIEKQEKEKKEALMH